LEESKLRARDPQAAFKETKKTKRGEPSTRDQWGKRDRTGKNPRRKEKLKRSKSCSRKLMRGSERDVVRGAGFLDEPRK